MITLAASNPTLADTGSGSHLLAGSKELAERIKKGDGTDVALL